MDLSDYAAQQLTDWITGVDSMPAATTRYAALFNGDPQGAGSEVTTTIRPAGRVAITSDMTAADSSGNSSNDAAIDFGDADAGATVTHIGIYDAASGGNLIASDAIASGSQAISAGNAVSIPIGDLDVASA